MYIGASRKCTWIKEFSSLVFEVVTISDYEWVTKVSAYHTWVHNFTNVKYAYYENDCLVFLVHIFSSWVSVFRLFTN